MHPFPADPIRIILVKGSDRQIGRQHAEQLGDKIAQGMAPFYTSFFDRVTKPPGLSLWENLGLNVLLKGMDTLLIQKLISQIPQSFKERMAGIAEVSGVKEDTLLKAFILPDLLPMLQAYLVRMKPHLGASVAFPQMGCSSFVAKGKKFIQGRNLDFPGVAYWDRYPVLQVIRPKDKLSYIAISSAGVPLGGISGVNELGISVALHQHYSTHTDRGGVLPFVVSERILSEARTLEQALSLIQSHALASSWAFVVADAQSQNAFIYEGTPQISGVRWLKEEGNLLTHSNYFQSRECRSQDYATTDRMNWDNFWRRETLDRILRSNLEELSAELAISAISDHTDGFWKEEKTINRTVSQVYNIQSYVIDFSDQKLFVAEGNCPIHLQRFREFDLSKIFKGDFSGSVETKKAYEFKDTSKKHAKEEYILSFVSAFNGDDEEAFRRLQKSLKFSFVPEAALVAALVNFRLHGDLNYSIQILEQGQIEIEDKVKRLGIQTMPPEYFELLLYQARGFDLKGNHSAALKVYQKILQSPALRDANIRRWARAGKKYSPKRIKRLVMPYSSYIPFD